MEKKLKKSWSNDCNNLGYRLWGMETPRPETITDTIMYLQMRV